MGNIMGILHGNVSLHLNILLLLGIALFGGTIGGDFFHKLKIPQVVGYIVIGIAIGRSGFGIISPETIDAMGPFSYFALGLIGFMIGGELKRSVFKKYGRQFMYILFSEGLTAFLFISFLVVIFLILSGWSFKAAFSLGILLGAIGSATAPAATTDVLWEYKTRGPLTRTVFGIVALDDGLALFLFAISSAAALWLGGNSGGNFLKTLFYPVYQIFGAILLGGVLAVITGKILRHYFEEDKILAFTVGMVLLGLGTAMFVKVDILLTAMTLGIVIVNFIPQRSIRVFDVISKFTPPIYILFFVMFGAKLNVSNLTFVTLILAVVYLVGRTSGKMLGARYGAKISGAPRSVVSYLPYCLFSQAGVAIGLSIIASHRFSAGTGDVILIVITSTTFIVQIIGPPFVKYAVSKAGEVGLNITEEELMKQYKVKDLMDTDIPFFKPQTHLSEILATFAEYPNSYFPVVDRNNKLIGVITIGTIRETFIADELHEFLLAMDLMSKPIEVIFPENSIDEANQIMEAENLESLPVVSDEETAVGMLERRKVKNLISRKLMEMHRVSS